MGGRYSVETHRSRVCFVVPTKLDEDRVDRLTLGESDGGQGQAMSVYIRAGIT